jgi:hypothetical protein
VLVTRSAEAVPEQDPPRPERATASA